MGLFDSVKNSIKNEVKANLKNEINSVVNKAVSSAAQKAETFTADNSNISGTASTTQAAQKSETFTFDALPKTLAELQALPESDLSTPFKTAALTILALARYNESPDDALEMLEWLNGPNEVNTYTKQFINEHLGKKQYLIDSYFNGSSPENNYTPSKPYSITISDNPYSYQEENWAVMHVTSSGADNPRQIKMRLKPSTGQWFLNEQFLLAEIRVPKEEDPWA